MASSGFSDAATGGTEEKQQPPPPYNPTSYGYDQPADGPTGPKYNPNPTNYGYDQPGDRQYGFSQQGYGYSPYPGPYTAQPPPVATSTNTNIVVNSGPGFIVAPARENTPPPDTACSLILSIIALICCAWPCGIGALVYNRKAKAYVDVGQHANARSALTSMWIWIGVSVIFGIACWVYVGIKIKDMLEVEEHELNHYNGYNNGYNNGY